MRCNPAFSSIHQVKSHCGGPTVWYPHAVWSHHDDEPMHHHAAADDRPPACRHQLRATAVDRRPDGSTCCDRVVGEIDVVCCQMWRKWRARIEENCPRSVGPTNHRWSGAACCCCCWCWRWCVTPNQMTANHHTLREPDRQLMQLTRRPTTQPLQCSSQAPIVRTQIQ